MSTSRSPSSQGQYWCHECNASVQSVEGLDDPMCSLCHGSFLEELEADLQIPEDLVEDMQTLPPLLSHLFTSAFGGGLPPRSPTSPTSSNSAASTRSSPNASGRQQPDGPDVLLARLMHMALHPPQNPQPSSSGSGSSSQQPQAQRTTTPMPGGFQGGFQTFFTTNPAPPSPHGPASTSSAGGSPRSGPAPAGMSTPPLPPFLATLLTGLGLPMNAQGGFNFGDFVFSQEHLDRIAEQLGHQGPQPQQEGMPADFFAKGLPDVDIIEAQAAKGLECVICQDKFAVGEPGVCKLGSCDHMFHRECVEPWLKKNHTCPTCRWDVLAEWQASKEGRDRMPWAETPGSSHSRGGASASASGSERAAGGAGGAGEGQDERTPGSWEPEIEPLD